MSAALSHARSSSRPVLPWTLAVILVLVLAACSASASASATDGGGGEGSNVITLSGQAFHPETLTIPFGEAIEFNNDDGRNHRIVEGEDGTEVADPAFAAISLGAGDRSQEIRLSPGTYHLTCTIHSHMNMTVTVEEE